jgi:glycosyltransferase involved in cell wall biosynthesis
MQTADILTQALTELPESFEMLGMSPALDLRSVRIAVCVPTFKRPELLEQTLRSLAAQQGAPPFAVIIVDNEGIERAGAQRALQLINTNLIPSVVLCEPRQGNCKAYNAAWRFSLTRMPQIEAILGIDDDEIADPHWLSRMVEAAERTSAGIIGGSVVPVFEDPRGERFRAHPIFRSHYTQSGPVPQIYSSANYLIRPGVLHQMGYPFLDEAFDFTGGGDTDFFIRCRAEGITFHWQHDAAMTEIMPARRTELSWITARGLRNGQISALIEKKPARGLRDHMRRWAKTAALLALSPFRSVALAVEARSWVVGQYHINVAVGRVMAEFGLSTEQYRKPEAN